MSWRKGWYGENKIKKILIKEAGSNESVIKSAIGQAQDYIVVSNDSPRLVKVVEVKTKHITPQSNKYYPTNKEKKQFMRICEFAKKRSINAELYIYYIKGKKTTIEKFNLLEYVKTLNGG